MSDTIAALKAEIEAARKKQKPFPPIEEAHTISKIWEYGNQRDIDGYIAGLQTAMRLLEQEQAQELPY